MKRILFAALFALFATSANAASCFWVGGSGTWSVTNIGGNSGPAAWATGSDAGASGSCTATGGVPKNSADIANFTGGAGGLNGGTVTVDSSMNGLTISSIVAGAMNGTLDFSVSNPSLSLISGATALSFTGTGTRTIKMGTGTFTVTAGGQYDLTTTTNLNAASDFSHCTIVMQITTAAPAQTFTGGGQIYGTLTWSGARNGTFGQLSSNSTFGTLNVGYPGLNLSITTTTITSALNVVGSSTAYVFIGNVASSNSVGSIAVGGATVTLDRTVLRDASFAGTPANGPVSATNSIDMGDNVNVTITAPVSGGGGGGSSHIIGG